MDVIEKLILIACKSLLNLSKCASLPLHSDINQLMAKDFDKFFRDKINSIRLEIARQCSTSDVNESHFALEGPSFSEFRLLSETEVHELIKSLTKTTCSLNSNPTRLFTECLDVFPPPITKLNFRWNQAIFLLSERALC